ncbi:DUF6992 family protein [Catalinimonas niigatensis]|uniref:DUF6992 family protein n=1 Tax=Catalinimonas niigatensis TaxID=1397264 RepID=UPI002666C195|nr:hypothetical protein [Catalinimonas niigatensis]WPP49975.1 hypothetical protein PZB72_25255 [Catalinimonas niigatensis]
MKTHFSYDAGFKTIVCEQMPYLLTTGVFNPSSPKQTQQYNMQAFDHRIKQLKMAHARVLLAWAGVNTITSCILIFMTEAALFYFYAMNVCWGIVNTVVAAFIFYHHNHVFKKPLTLLQQMDYQRHAEKMILFNIGLDIAFVAVGSALYQQAYASIGGYIVLWKGFGAAVMMQGTFLCIQDSLFYWLHSKNRQKIYPLWQRMTENL